MKLFWACMSQRLSETAVAVLGPDALLVRGDDDAVERGRWPLGLLATRANSIMGGTSEIQRNIIGEQLLGLPREARARHDRRRRSARAHRSGALRASGLSPRRVDATAGRGAGRVLRAGRATSRSGRSRSTPTSWRSRSNPCSSPVSRGSRCAPRASCSRRPRWSSCSIPPDTVRCAVSRTGASRRGRCEDSATTSSASRSEILDEAAPAGASGELDFVERIAAPFPLAVIAWVLGVPSDDWQLMFRWTNEVIGKDDPEYRLPGETPGQTSKRARGEMHAYFRSLIDERRTDPRDDLVSELHPRRDRREAAQRGTARLVLRAPRRSGQRDDAQRGERRSARVLRAPRPVGEAARRS